MPTYSNGRGQSIDSSLSHSEALRLLPENQEWVLYYLHKYAAANAPRPNASAASAVQYLCDLFTLGSGYGLIAPKLRVHFKDMRFKLFTAKTGTLCLKAGNVVISSRKPYGREHFVGTFWQGEFSSRGRAMNATEKLFVKLLCDDVREFILDCSRDMGMCCYCGMPLECPKSKLLGYGPICAKRYGLPWKGDMEYLEKAPNFAKVHDDTASGCCNAIRQSPGDASLWLMFADWLEERGLPRISMPKRLRRLPRMESGGGKVRGKDVPLPWLKSRGIYAAEASALPKGEKCCPRCETTIMSSDIRSSDERSTRLVHANCGARIVVFNT
jgi:uncharacterized protein (TIGR02996 family)